MTIANDQIACPECGYGWNDYTRGFHYTHCSKVAHLNHEQLRPEQAGGETTVEIWPFCAKNEHHHCAGEAQLKRNGPPSRCSCDCHKTAEHDGTPAAPERGGYSPLPWRHQTEDGTLGTIVDADENVIAQTQQILNDPAHVKRQGNAAFIVRTVNQHSALVAQRERLLTALKRMLDVFAPYANPDTEQWREEVEAYDEAQAVLTTIEQEQSGEGQ